MCPQWFQSFLAPPPAGPRPRLGGGGKGELAATRARVAAALLGNPPPQLSAAASRRRRPPLFKFSDAIVWETCSPGPARGPRVREGPQAAARSPPPPLPSPAPSAGIPASGSLRQRERPKEADPPAAPSTAHTVCGRRDAAAQEQPVRIAPHLPGLLPARRRRSAAVELGAARPPLSPARGERGSRRIRIVSECARLEGRRHRCGRRAAESGPAFQVSGQGFGGCGAPRVGARFSPKICSRGALEPRVGAVDAPWVRGLPTRSAQIPVAEACGWGQRGRRPGRPAGGRAQAPTRAPHRGPPLEPPRLGARGSASGKFVPRTARSLLSPLPLANGVGSCVTLSLATPKAKLQGRQSPWVAARSPPGGRRDCQVSPAPGPGPARTGKGVTAGEAGGAAGRRHFWYFQVVPAWKQARTWSASVPSWQAKPTGQEETSPASSRPPPAAGHESGLAGDKRESAVPVLRASTSLQTPRDLPETRGRDRFRAGLAAPPPRPRPRPRERGAPCRPAPEEPPRRPRVAGPPSAPSAQELLAEGRGESRLEEGAGGRQESGGGGVGVGVGVGDRAGSPFPGPSSPLPTPLGSAAARLVPGPRAPESREPRCPLAEQGRAPGGAPLRSGKESGLERCACVQADGGARGAALAGSASISAQPVNTFAGTMLDALQLQAEPLSLTFSPIRHRSETKELFQASPGSISEAGLCAPPGSALNLGHGAECASLVPGEREKMGFCLGSKRK
ncbi:collagen alpha-1(I) chain-like [Eubalaena glacialis]|uniref:collagen alpha-1(I) chain-like n=1 Tax=Eubalaena glacialis TaxID=27606 RepID=UPI002A59A8F1|nr:collagen alpha-1(I) chain-like [Eubalaena glacialis]